MRAAVLQRFGEPLVEAEVELAGIAPDEATRGLEQLDRSDGARSVISFAGGRG